VGTAVGSVGRYCAHVYRVGYPCVFFPTFSSSHMARVAANTTTVRIYWAGLISIFFLKFLITSNLLIYACNIKYKQKLKLIVRFACNL
jgi:hypothetical protein